MELNEAQRAAVHAPDGPALVLAGAGSGKTRVIVERIVHLVDERGIDPRRILALTFTNRAAGEMGDRVRARLGVERLATWLGTFHSFGLYVLRREMELLGRSRQVTIIDDSDQLSLAKRLIKALPNTYAPVSPRDALRWMSALKQELQAPEAEAAESNPEEKTYQEIWKQYHAALKQASAVDFDDLLTLPVRIFQEHPDALEKYRRRFPYVLIDEYQDTNHAQYVLAELLAGEGGNLFVVGDEDQSIYSWRGANIDNILDFEETFPGAQVYKLEENYRSTAPILEAANGVVAHNKARLGKRLFTRQSGGDKIALYEARDAEDEAAHVVDAIKKRQLEPRETAVLYRTNGQARLVEEVCLRKGVPYRIIGGVRFYARKEIKDVLCYLRLVVNPDDDEAFRRVVNVPPRGIGAVTLQRFQQDAQAQGVSLAQAARLAEDDPSMTTRVQEGLKSFFGAIDACREASGPVAEQVENLLDVVDYRAYVEKSDAKDFRAGLELLEEFVSSCARFDERGAGGLPEMLNELALVSDADGYKPDEPAVSLMTCHAAKGLEFDHVFLIGLEEGLLPHAISLDEDAGLEEERRLCYVAMTRARKSLSLSYARSRMTYGERNDSEPSRFIGEIPETVIARERDRSGEGRSIPAPWTVGSDRLSTGTRVRHAKFGRGVVMFTSGTGPKTKVRIRFDTGMSRQFMVSAAPLEILEK